MNIQNLTQQPQTVTLMDCSRCKSPIGTNHKRTETGWSCNVCGNIDEPQTITEQRRESLLQQVAQDPGRLTDEVVEELAELEGSDTSLNNQLYDAGFGPGGVY